MTVFHDHLPDKRHKYWKEYQLLCETTNFFYKTGETKAKQELVLDFWDFIYEAIIEANKPGTTGFVQDLFKLLHPLLILQPFYEETRNRYACEFEEKKKVR